jgi:hypothetical protein
MTWRTPRFNYLHAARDAGAGNISLPSYAWATGLGADFLVDDRQGTLATFSTSETDHMIDLDRGSGSLDAIDRAYIPSSHTAGGSQARLIAADDAGFTSGVTLLKNYSTFTTGAAWDQDFLASNTQRYVRLEWGSGSPTGAWGIPELIYTYPEALTIGPEPEWEDYLAHNTLDFPKESGGVASLALGADRRFIRYVYRHVDVAADLTIFSELLSTCGTSKPFLLDPCFGTAPSAQTVPAVWMKLTEDSRQSLDRASPGSPDSARPMIPLSMLEHLA